MTTTTADRATGGYALAQDEGEAFWLAGLLQTVKIGGADTGGRYGLIEVVVPPGLGSPWHVHPEEDEYRFQDILATITSGSKTGSAFVKAELTSVDPFDCANDYINRTMEDDRKQ